MNAASEPIAPVPLQPCGLVSLWDMINFMIPNYISMLDLIKVMLSLVEAKRSPSGDEETPNSRRGQDR